MRLQLSPKRNRLFVGPEGPGGHRFAEFCVSAEPSMVLFVARSSFGIGGLQVSVLLGTILPLPGVSWRPLQLQLFFRGLHMMLGYPRGWFGDGFGCPFEVFCRYFWKSDFPEPLLSRVSHPRVYPHEFK